VPGALVHHPGQWAFRDQPQHPVLVSPGSRLASILGHSVAQLEVNSFHHQAAEIVGPPLRVAARAPDGIVEALECPDRCFVLGVQWHPEEMAAAQAAQQAIFAAFVEACTARRCC